MVTRIFKINENITAYEDKKNEIEKLKADFSDKLTGLTNQLKNYGANIDYFKDMTDEEFDKRW